MPFALFLLHLWRALFMSRAEVLIRVFACSLRGRKCKAYSKIEVGIHEPWCFLAKHVLAEHVLTEPSGTLPFSLKRIRYWSWTTKPNACRCGSTRPIAFHKALPLQKQWAFFFVCEFCLLCCSCISEPSAKSQSSAQQHCFVKCSNDLLADVYKDTNEFCSFLSKSNCFAWIKPPTSLIRRVEQLVKANVGEKMYHESEPENI